MSEEFLILTDEPVKVKDSWDLLDTPRTSQSESDNLNSNRQLWFDDSHSQQDGQSFRQVSREAKVKETRTNAFKDRRCGILKTHNKVVPSPRNDSRPSQRLNGLFQESRPVDAQSFTQPTKTVPKRYRKLGLRSHDEMLQQEMDQLRHLLNESENMSREELGRQHIAQTANMIAEYKAVNRGVGKKGVIVSRSLPESLRPKSPRSSSDSSHSSFSGSSYRRSGYSSSRSPSDDSRRDTKRVSFRQTSRKTRSAHSSSSRERSNSPAGELRGAHELRQSAHIGKRNNPKQILQSTDYKLPGNPVKGKQGAQHQYLSSETGVRKIRTQKKNMLDLEKSFDLPFSVDEQKAKHGVIEDINGCKHSDSNLKRTSNLEIKRWLREKEKAIKEMKKKQKKEEKKEQTAKELELKKKEEREKESAKQLKQWTHSKKKEARLLRRKNQAKQKIKPRESIAEGETKPAEKTASPGDNTYPVTKPAAHPRRPQSAPTGRRNVKPRQVPISQVIKTSPDLQERLKQLEKQKRLKHRQTYEEWVKIKEKEKKDTMKVIREQRKQLEKEITEETARVISEAAKRRIDNVPYKGSTTPSAGSTPKTGNATAKDEKAKPEENTWTKEDITPSNQCNTGAQRNTTSGSAPMPTPPRRPPSSTPKPRKPNVEEKISSDNNNPFKDPFKPTKQRRPKSKLKESGVNGPEFSRFIWELVNEQEGSRPEPQGADSPEKSNEPALPADKNGLKTAPKPHQSASPTPPPNKMEESHNKKVSKRTDSDPVIENGKNIFAMTSIE